MRACQNSLPCDKPVIGGLVGEISGYLRHEKSFRLRRHCPLDSGADSTPA
jgi:hypothetical protein